ncbi:MAG: S-layer homology domain-containing protein [Peptococcaceae bacterium MAG4]|nr:S-layer homology domain-containing protein [Peptococcaceae bacterium MAG4]
MKTRLSSLVIALCLVLSMAVTAFAAPLTDIENHWAKEQIKTWEEKGLVKGYEDGTFRPDNNVSRAEFMALVNRAFNYQEKAEIDYKDVKEDAWYADVIKIAKAAGYISGYEDGTMRPNNPISRQEAAIIIMKILGLEENAAGADKFQDASSIPAWSKGAVGAVASAGIMGGYPDGTFRAASFITRAEAVVTLDRALSGEAGVVKEDVIYDKAGTYGPETGTEVINRNVIITAAGVTLQNTIIEGDLTIDEAVGAGDVNLKKVTVKGDTYIYGGGKDSIYFIDSQTGRTYVLKDAGPVRIVVSGTTDMDELIAQSGVTVEEVDLTGEGVKVITVDKKVDGNIEINLKGVNLEKLEINTPGVIVRTDRNTTINHLTVNAKTDFRGQGTISNAVINADGVTFEKMPEKYEVAEGVEPPTLYRPSGGGRGGGGLSPVASTYKFSYQVPADVVAGREVVVPVTFATDAEGDFGYDGVRFKFAADGPGDVTFKAVDSNGIEHTFTNQGYWGPAEGFNLPADYSATTDWTLVFSEAGKYTITFSLIDAATGDVIAGITETVEITVAEPEPVVSTYKFSYEVPADVVAGKEVVVPVTFETDGEPGDIGYEGVRFKFAAEGPGDVTFKAVDSNEVEHTFTNEGYWGPTGGFELPAEYEATTDWTLVFSEAGKYTITFSLIDAATGDVIAGITETVEITVAEPEPVASTYKFSYEVPADVVAGQEVEVPVTFKTDVKGDIGYEGVRFKFAAEGPGDVTFKAVDSNEVEHTFTNEGYWGPTGGFELPAEYEATTDWTLVFSEAGKYTITFSLIDAATGDVIAGITETVEITVAEPEPVASTYKFSYEVPADVVAGQEVEVPVTFKTDVKGDIGYEGVRFKFAAEGPGDVTFKAVDSNEVEHTFTNEGYWGPTGGFELPAEYSATTDWTLVFSEAGKYTITFSLIDAATGDVIAGITKTVEITVAEPEPVVSTYKFSYEVPADVVAGQEVEVPVTFKTDVKGDIGYEGVRFKFAAEGPGDVTFKAVDSNEVEHTFTNEGYWGPTGGFELPAEYSATTDWTLVFSEAGKYTITFSLIDAATGDVIAGITETVEITVAEPEPVASTYKFSYEVPADVVAGQEVEVPVTFKTDVKGDIGYEGVRFKFAAEGLAT